VPRRTSPWACSIFELVRALGRLSARLEVYTIEGAGFRHVAPATAEKIGVLPRRCAGYPGCDAAGVRPSFAVMSIQHETSTLRETVDELGRRLARIGTAASSLQNVAADIRHGVPPADLLPLFQQIERDLALTA
jgi:hypothetical protein